MGRWMFTVPALIATLRAITDAFHVDPDEVSESEVVIEEIMEDDAIGCHNLLRPPFATEDNDDDQRQRLRVQPHVQQGLQHFWNASESMSFTPQGGREGAPRAPCSADTKMK